ncbi:hypothetical protein Hdeb2414_s0012g00392171 [Helianthus debilis subsp. tardiflorus]
MVESLEKLTALVTRWLWGNFLDEDDEDQDLELKTFCFYIRNVFFYIRA